MNMVYGILSALYWRERSGKGQEIKVDLLTGCSPTRARRC